MSRKNARPLFIIAATAVLLLFTHLPNRLQAHAGGQTQLAEATAGPFLISAWSLPNPMVAGDANLVFALAQPPDGFVILGADINLTLTPQSGGEPIQVAATHENATNKLFYESYMPLSAGVWQVDIHIAHNDQQGSAQFVLDVPPAPPPINWMLIGGIAVVVLAVLWFIWQARQEAQEAD